MGTKGNLGIMDVLAMGNVGKADSLNRQALIAFSFSTHSQKGNMKKVPIERSDFGGQVEGTARLPVVLEMAPARPVSGIERQEFRFFHKIVLLFPERYHGGEDSSSPAFSIFGESVLPDLTSREAAGIFLTYDTMNGGICNDGKSV